MHWDPASVADSIRYEKKYMIVGKDTATVVDHLLMNGFCEEFGERTICNVYFDSEDLKSFSAHLAGVMDRHKLRFRWYEQGHEDFAQPALEIKARRGDVGYKFRFSVDGLTGPRDVSRERISAKVLPDRIREELQQSEANVYITYKRRYFRHAFQRDLRLTIDFDMKARNVGDEQFVSLSDRTLVEVKYPPAAHTVDWNSAFGAGKLNEDLSLQPLRFSKYVTAIEKLRIS